MPANELVGAAINSGGSLISTVANNLATATQNRKSRQFAEKIRAEDRKWALDDWARNNEYNSPAAQRSRLEEAGINPATFYGGSGNIAQASEVRSTDTKMPEFRPANFDGISGASSFLSQMYDLEIKKQSLDNLKSQNTKTIEEAAYVAAQRENTLVGTMRSKFDLDLESELRDVSMDYRKQQVKQLAANVESTLSATVLRKLETTSSLALQAQQLIHEVAKTANTQAQYDQIKQATELMKKDGRLKEIEISLRKEGINPNDPAWMRVLTMYVKSMLDGGSVLNAIKGQMGNFQKAVPAIKDKAYEFGKKVYPYTIPGMYEKAYNYFNKKRK